MIRKLFQPRVLVAAAALLAGVTFAVSASARDAKAVIASKSELSQFNDLIDHTGTANLFSGNYTVFAPVNDSFSRYPSDRYPYLYGASPGNEDLAAKVVKNHVVPGTVFLDSVTAQKGGVFSVDGRFIAIAESPKGTFWVDGHRVVNARALGAGMFYEIDGLIAKPWETAEIVQAPSPSAGGDTTIVVPPGADVTVQQNAAPDGSTTTTISPR
jgi:uncharacterized surface protein with fasciclin (FAS1) repeats